MIERVATTGSTNADLSARLAAGERIADGHWLVADQQTAGRGRHGREWLDGAGNFMGSTVVNLGTSNALPQTLALAAGLAVFGAIQAVAPYLTRLALKWPNDLLLDGAKLAGILLVRHGDSVVVGIGVNIREAPEVAGRSTTSLANAGYLIDRDDFAKALEGTWQAGLKRWHEGEWDAIRRDWVQWAHPIGTPLAVGEPGEQAFKGRFAGLDNDGALLLALADGTTRTVHAGEVRLAAPD